MRGDSLSYSRLEDDRFAFHMPQKHESPRVGEVVWREDLPSAKSLDGCVQEKLIVHDYRTARLRL
ncbi:MAG: hypothetical protein RIC55_21305 [Pirellulaceae bacterium]